MHVVIVRYCPSFVEGDLIKGTHEQIETEINKRKYPYKDGYCIPFASEFKILDYRVKKECVGAFLRDLGITNLNPKKRVTFFDLFRKKYAGNSDHHLRGKMALVMFLFGLLSKLGLWFKPYDAEEGERKDFFPNTFCYNFFLGVIEDPEGKYGEEL
jgi:hypothetical protein